MRIIFTAGRRLIVLNANTGAPLGGFSTVGEVDMVPYNSVPLVYKDVIIVGASRAVFAPLSRSGVIGIGLRGIRRR